MTMPTFDFDREPGSRDITGFLVPRKVKLDEFIGEDPGVTAGRVLKALARSGQNEAAIEYLGQIGRCTTYGEFLGVIMTYADLTLKSENEKEQP